MYCTTECLDWLQSSVTVWKIDCDADTDAHPDYVILFMQYALVAPQQLVPGFRNGLSSHLKKGSSEVNNLPRLWALLLTEQDAAKTWSRLESGPANNMLENI